MHMSMQAARAPSSSIFTSLRNCVATLCSASAGHSENQSMVQQFTSDGNLRRRSRNASPTGDMHSTQCRYLRHSCTKNLNFSCAGAPSLIPAFLARTVTASAICAISSFANRFGTSPVLSTLLMSSRNDSILICVSEKRNTVGLPSAPALRSTIFRSSRHSNAP